MSTRGRRRSPRTGTQIRAAGRARRSCPWSRPSWSRTVSTVAATPAIRAVEEAGVPFSLHEYEHDPGVGSYGAEAAAKLDVEPERLFKTLVVSVDGSLVVACVPVDCQLDLKALGKR